jgi:hypothetical protein
MVSNTYASPVASRNREQPAVNSESFENIINLTVK